MIDAQTDARRKVADMEAVMLLCLEMYQYASHH